MIYISFKKLKIFCDVTGCPFELNDFKGNAQIFQKETFEPLMGLKQNHYGSSKCYKS